MKRTEMLELIEEVLHPCNGTYKTSREKTAKRVLDLIEEEGMLPPCENCINNLPCDYYCQGAGIWEENETH